MNQNVPKRISTLITTILFLIVATCTTNAQTKGQVLDAKLNKPLTGVNIVSTSLGFLSVTNGKGEFPLRDLSKLNRNDSLSFSHVGYATRKVSFPELKEMSYVLTLVEDDQQLKEITVVSSLQPLQQEIRYKKLASLKEGVY